MNAFSFTTVPSLLVDFGGARRLGTLLRERYRDERRLVLVTDRFLNESGLIAPALEDLAAQGWQVTVIDDVIADPPDHVVLDAAARAKASGAQVVLGLGGGSSMDVAKLIAVLCASAQPLEKMYGVGNVEGPRLPLVLMPTTAGTGSEVTAISIVTTGATTKSGVVSPILYPDLALLDAELTLGLPPQATAATGIDAMVHAIESYTSARLKNPLSDMLAKEALRLLYVNLLPACRDGRNRAAREAMLLGATLAGQAFSNAPVAAVHALAYPLGGHFHVPHGLSNALVLMHVLRFNAPAAAPLYAELADTLGCAAADDSIEAKTEAFIQAMQTLVNETGIPRTLREVGVNESHLPMLAADAMKQQRLLINNPREMTETAALAIYEAAL
ncbi:alcohol dehydrogenase [Burkholderia sp. SFA1]|uniref:iron-containing alcohol dehydrogenase n=1 Tax=Caballeronia sp. CLC5 TaxID=2906764 RepID=UPI001F443930|nr:iron-containing alcohol dehydrogenase [Caballeronia sp. CLC5]MCE4573996.1 iron-containing alcohol dehydrogenase [Caballeronia sp. CLC5]BBQ00848.1 alcohol dehydrogenase [Burkholderia sp. SFA1]